MAYRRGHDNYYRYRSARTLGAVAWLYMYCMHDAWLSTFSPFPSFLIAFLVLIWCVYVTCLDNYRLVCPAPEVGRRPVWALHAFLSQFGR